MPVEAAALLELSLGEGLEGLDWLLGPVRVVVAPAALLLQRCLRVVFRVVSRLKDHGFCIISSYIVLVCRVLFL